MSELIQDPHFRVEVVNSTPDPNYTCWVAMHQDYSEGAAIDSPILGNDKYDEEWFGNKVVEHCLNHGHFGPIEHPALTVNAIGFPHSVMQQLRTHRLLTFDVQSMRYSGMRIANLGKTLGTTDVQGEEEQRIIEDVFYLRPVGHYVDRQGKKYYYDEQWRTDDVQVCRLAAIKYWKDTDRGMSEEHARGTLPFDFRQNFVVSFNMRALMHLIAVRGMADTQIETQTFIRFVVTRFVEWSPVIGGWFEKKHYGKNRLAP